MKRIICTVTNDLNFDQRMIRICTSLSGAGYKVMLVGRQLPNSPILKKQPFQQKRLHLIFEKGKLFYIEYNVRLLFYLLFSRFDAVCSVDLDTLLPGYLVSKIKGKTCIYDAHEYFSEVPEVVGRPLVKKAWEGIADFTIPKLKFAYTVCESLAEIFYQKYRTPFAVIRNVPVRKPLLPQKKMGKYPFVLIYQGVLNDGRGLEETVEAIEQLKGVELWLAGEGDLSNMLREKVADKGLTDRIIFHGRVSPDKLHLLTSQAHLGLNLLKNKGLNYYYSLANKTFDYMQAGIPSLCMPFPEYKKLSLQSGALIIINELSASQISKAIESIRKDQALYQDLCEKNRRAAEEWIWEKEEEILLRFYSNVWAST